MSQADPGSFRDPASHIVFEADRVIRVLDQRGLNAWKALSDSTFYSSAVAEGSLIASTEVPNPPEGAPGALEHPRVPVITYPYEWTFSMLKDAAQLQLELLARALDDGLTIKDATPFNIQFVEGRPLFIDIGSFEPYRDGEPWIGYRQFTRQFLFPLMLRAWLDVPFQPWLRGDMEGPTASQMKSLLPAGKRWKPAALGHVVLQARMEQRLAGEAVRDDLSAAGFNAEMILANVNKLRGLVDSLSWNPTAEGWADYESCNHVGRDRETKAGFLRHSIGRVKPQRVLDLGANDAFFSEIAADGGAHAIAVDGDEAILEQVYANGAGKNLNVVLTDLANPSPSQGWSGVERPGIVQRSNPDLVIAYGLIHHLIYTASIPPASVLDWLRGFDSPVVLEYVAPDDEMVLKLTNNKHEDELHVGRDESAFRSLLAQRFSVQAEKSIAGGTRTLFDLTPA